MNNKLLFADLSPGDQFICYSSDDYNKNICYIFLKIKPVLEKNNIDEKDSLWSNCVKICSGNLSHFPDNIEVVKIK